MPLFQGSLVLRFTIFRKINFKHTQYFDQFVVITNVLSLQQLETEGLILKNSHCLNDA